MSIPLALALLLTVGAFIAGALLAVIVARFRARPTPRWAGADAPPEDPATGELYAQGVDAQRAGKQAAALAAFQEVLRRQPGHGEAHARMGELARGRGDDQSALVHSLQALRTDDRAETLLAAADAYRQTGRPGDAIALFQDIIARDPGHVTALRALRDLAVAEGRWADALPAQERLMSAVAPDERASEQTSLAGIHYERGRARMAEGDLTGGPRPSATRSACGRISCRRRWHWATRTCRRATPPRRCASGSGRWRRSPPCRCYPESSSSAGRKAGPLG